MRSRARAAPFRAPAAPQARASPPCRGERRAEYRTLVLSPARDLFASEGSTLRCPSAASPCEPAVPRREPGRRAAWPAREGRGAGGGRGPIPMPPRPPPVGQPGREAACTHGPPRGGGGPFNAVPCRSESCCFPPCRSVSFRVIPCHSVSLRVVPCRFMALLSVSPRGDPVCLGYIPPFGTCLVIGIQRAGRRRSPTATGSGRGRMGGSTPATRSVSLHACRSVYFRVVVPCRHSLVLLLRLVESADSP